MHRSLHPIARRAALPRASRIHRAVRTALAATTAMLALAATEAVAAPTPVDDLTRVGFEQPMAVVGPIEILQPGDIVLDFADQVQAYDYAAPYDVTAVLLDSYGGDVLVDIAAGASLDAAIDADSGYVLARGLVSYGVDSFISNAGDIEVVAAVELGNSVAIGVAEFGDYFSTLYNTADGDISAAAWSGQGVYYGADANAFAVFVAGSSAYVKNYGGISAQAQADGEFAIAAATGVRTEAFYGFATLVNYGDIAAYASTTSSAQTKTYAFAYGVDTQAHYNYYTASTVNAGGILAVASAYRGGAISIGSRTSAQYAYTGNEAGASIEAASFVEYSGLASATGVETNGKYYAHDVNAGSITAYASSHGMAVEGYFSYGAAGATGVSEVANYFGGVVMENSGSISATAVTRDVAGFFFGGAAATGVYQYGKYYSGLDNSGDIHAQAYSELGIVSAYGVWSRGKYGAYTVVDNHEGASIVAEAASGSAAGDSYGGRAIAHGINMFGGSIALVYNDGLIAASAYVDANDRDYFDNPALAYAWGVEERGSYAAVLENAGTISAYAGADFGAASAYGVKATAQYYAFAYNEGDILAVADADDGIAFATGIYAHGAGRAVYLGCDPYGCHYAYYGGEAAVSNHGSVYAGADAQDGEALAYAVVAASRYEASIENGGEAVAVADAGTGYSGATAALVRSDYQGVYVHNLEEGLLLAGAYGEHAVATALWMGAADDAYLLNEGAIVANGDGARIAIDATAVYGDTLIVNTGVISGSILLGDGDDRLYNQAGGVLRLDNASIDLGADAGGGNVLVNSGTILVFGDSVVDMGSGAATLALALNSNAFYNDGLIDLQDGAADDSLTIVGDFDGDGQLAVDASPAQGSADQLYIDGSIAAGSVTTIDVYLVDLPESATTLVPIVGVSGDSVAGNFSLGAVGFDDAASFLAVDFSLVADIDAGNAGPDVFALGIEVTGLSDTGTLAAAVAPGVQGMLRAQVGTWRQRAGFVDAASARGFTPWARIFRERGSISPGHAAANFGNGGEFDWTQDSSGAEVGFEFAATDEVALGVLIAKSKAGLRLDAGAGHADLDADTVGAYATWISPLGLYLDGSYRWTSFDVDLSPGIGTRQASSRAGTFNLEAGYAWTLSGGLEVEPQLQYTRTRVDAIDVLTTASGMNFHADGSAGSRGRLGVALRKGFGSESGGWNWSPQATLSLVREFDGVAGYSINDSFFGHSSTGGNSALLELGVTARRGNWSASVGLDWQDGGAMDSFFGGQLGLRYTFGGKR